MDYFQNPLKARGLHPMGAPLVHPSVEWKSCHITNLRAGPRIFGLIVSKSTQRLWACGGQISPESTRRLEGLAKDIGPITSQGHLFVGQGRNRWQNGSTQDWIDSSPDNSLGLNIIRSIDPILPRSALRRRN
jgi:hypothetical protein